MNEMRKLAVILALPSKARCSIVRGLSYIYFWPLVHSQPPFMLDYSESEQHQRKTLHMDEQQSHVHTWQWDRERGGREGSRDARLGNDESEVTRETQVLRENRFWQWGHQRTFPP